MRLTVGPLPPAVYWRRRAAVLGGVLLVVLLVTYSCSGAGDDGADLANNKADDGKGGPGGPTFVTPSGSGDDRGHSDGSASPGDDGSGTGDAPPFGDGPGGDPGNGTAPACQDGDLSIEAEPAEQQTRVGARLRIDLVITNVSARACEADVGADAQEVQLQRGKQRVWSSDDCAPRRGSHVEVLVPDAPVERFWVAWDGKTSAPKCEGERTEASEGTYQIIPRLGNVVGKSVTLTVVR